jgi:Flp pilus assembly pilin Flp
MIAFAKTWVELRIDRRAVTALEYSLVAGVLVVTIVFGFDFLETHLSTKFSTIGGSL